MLASQAEPVLHRDRCTRVPQVVPGSRRSLSSVARLRALRAVYSTSSAVTVLSASSPARISAASLSATARFRPPSTHADVSTR